ncbi:MAG TPA: pilus assembly protein [Anaerolineae bacterium]|nr:pilus assembly protein [Anaerolineae bacterium]
MKKRKGQALIELALLFPILMILLSGVVEFGIFLNQYLSIMDAARNAARFASDGLYYESDNVSDCETTRDFYRQTVCLVNSELRQERPYIQMNDNATPNNFLDDYLDPIRGDDIVVSAFSVSDQQIKARFPDNDGWSYASDLGVGSGTPSRFTNADVVALIHEANAPRTGYVLVEIYYHYDQLLKLPWITAFVPDPALLYTYAFMPLSSAEPTATPIPTPEP